MGVVVRDGVSLTPSELERWGSSLKGTSGIQGRSEVSGIKVGAGGQKGGRDHCSFSEPSPHRDTEPAGEDHI